VVGEAVAGLGQQIGGIGQRMQEKEDKLSYAKAEAYVLKEELASKQELEADPVNYTTWVERHSERMKKARGTAAEMIRSRGDRQLFEARVEADIVRSTGDVAKGARVRHVDTELAGLNTALDGLQDDGINDPDDAVRQRTIGIASDMIAGAQEQGYLSAVDAQNKRRAWTQDYIIQRAELLKRDGDVEGAEKWYAANRRYLDPAADNALGSQIADAKEDRFVLVTAGEYTKGVPITEVGGGVSPTQFADPLRGRGGKPVKGGQFGAPRDGGSRTHAGVDFTGQRGQPVMSGAGGGTARVSRSAKGGNIVTIDHGKGVVTKYMHLDTVSVKDGQTVTDQTVIGGLGNTGVSTGPHLHYEVYVGGKKVDPTGLAGSRGPAAVPSRGDLGDIYKRIDADAVKNGWTPEVTERIKRQAGQDVERENALQENRWREAGREASIIIAGLGDKLTDINQLPKSVLQGMDPVAVASLQADIRDRNERAAEIKAGGKTSLDLDVMSRLDREGFANLDLNKYRNSLTLGEYNAFVRKQADIIASPDKGPDYRSGIQSAITWGSKYGGVKVEDESFPAVFDIMEGYISEVAKSRPPTKDDYDAAFKAATREVNIVDGGFAWFDSKEPLYQIEYNEIPDKVIADIKKAWAGSKPPTEADIMRIFRQRFTGRIK
jgi:soluble lytic murein transglycosylase